MESINVLLVDDHSVVRAGFVHLLSLKDEFNVIGQAGCFDEAITVLKYEQVDVVIMDINMPNTDGIQATQMLKKDFPNVAVIILSIHETEPFISRSFEAGANAYLSKRCAPDELEAAIKSVHTGKAYVSADIASTVSVSELSTSSNKINQLTQRELEIFNLIAEGKSPADIAEELSLSRKTIYVHRENIYKKLGINSTFEIYSLALSLK